MKLLHRYIFKQVALSALVFTFLFVVVWVSPEILFKIIKQAVDGSITPVIAFKLFFLELPDIIGKAIPAGVLLGSLYVFDRLSRESELTIFRGIGVSPLSISIPVIVMSLICSVFCFFTSDILIPRSTLALKQMKNDYKNDHFVYLDKTKSGKPKQILIIENYVDSTFTNIKLLDFSKTENADAPLINNIVTAKSALWTGNSFVFKDALRYKIDNDGVYKDVERFKNLLPMTQTVSQNVHKLIEYSEIKPKQMNLQELSSYYKLLKSLEMKEESDSILNKLYQRFSQSFACIFLGICGFILGFSKPREKKILGFTIGVGLIALYYIIAPFVDMLVQIKVAAPIVAAWIPDGIIILAIAILLKYKRI